MSHAWCLTLPQHRRLLALAPGPWSTGGARGGQKRWDPMPIAHWHRPHHGARGSRGLLVSIGVAQCGGQRPNIAKQRNSAVGGWWLRLRLWLVWLVVGCWGLGLRAAGLVVGPTA
jgi:hypothetical protein